MDTASHTDRKGEKKADAASGASSGKLAEIEGTVGKIAKVLGIAGDEDGGEKDGGQVPNLTDAVKDLKKRIDDLENTPGSKTSLDEGDDEDDETKGGEKGKGSVFKGLL